jgi:sugar/nucleoside kinase (ribokinase family)
VIAVVGYASVDRVRHLDRLPAPGVTARVVARAGDGAARAGGIGHTAEALAGSVAEVVVPVCAVGGDAAGHAFRSALADSGCRTDGVVTLPGRTPNADLLYAPDGAAACVFDAGVEWERLDDAQRSIVAAADVVVLLIGPAGVTEDVLATMPADATLAWIVKNDPASLTPAIRNGLRRRAAIVFHNAAEEEVVAGVDAAPAVIRVRTDGPHPVVVSAGARSCSYPVALSSIVGDPTGAGDAFAAGFLAGWLPHRDDIAACVAAGAAAARRRIEAAP